MTTPPQGSLSGRRVLVVGASAGIGRSFAVRAVRAGAQVVMSARRADQLALAIDQAGGGTAAPGDVCDHASRLAMVEAAVAHLGEIDLLLYTAGSAPFGPVIDADADTWRRTFDLNVVAVNQVLRLVVPRLSPIGVAAVLSSETAAVPRASLVPYAASKAALETSLQGWRNEHGGTRFSCVAVGPTQPTEFGAGFDAEMLGAAFEHWSRHGLLQEEFMATHDVAHVLVAHFAAALDHPGVNVDHVVLRSPSAVVGTSDWAAADRPGPG